jgi:hypothetical protein
MRITLAQRLNRDILVTFMVIAALFVGLGAFMQLQWKNDNIQTVCRFLDMLVTRERSNMANELFEQRFSALEMRLAEISGHEDVIFPPCASLGSSRPPERLWAGFASTTTCLCCASRCSVSLPSFFFCWPSP